MLPNDATTWMMRARELPSIEENAAPPGSARKVAAKKRPKLANQDASPISGANESTRTPLGARLIANMTGESRSKSPTEPMPAHLAKSAPPPPPNPNLRPMPEETRTRLQRAEKIIDEVLDGRAEDENSQTRVAMEILKMEKPQDGPKSFGNVIIQGKQSLEDWDEMRTRFRSLGK